MLQFLIQYTIKPELVDEQETAIRAFLDGIRSVGDPDAYYGSFKAEDGVSYTHIARFESEEALKRFQAQPHFKTFSEGLRPRCIAGPAATKLALVDESAR